jgi:hypothetical protein
MQRNSGLLAAAVFFSGAVALLAGEQAKKLTSAQLFSTFSSVFSQSPISKGEFETLKPGLEEDGFSTSDRLTWRMSDASGRVLITALPDQGMFAVQYRPLAPSAFGDSALAALINKAEIVEVDDGDVIVITVASRGLSKDTRKGTRSERLKFNLRGGVWQETRVDVDWK